MGRAKLFRTSSFRDVPLLRTRFEECFPFRPSTLTVFQRKWRWLIQFPADSRNARDVCPMGLIAFSRDHKEARREARWVRLRSLSRVPIDRAGQLGEIRLDPALDSDITCAQNKIDALDADCAKGLLNDISSPGWHNDFIRILRGRSDQSAQGARGAAWCGTIRAAMQGGKI